MSKKGSAPRSRPSAQAVARARQRHRREKWFVPGVIGLLVVALVGVVIVTLTVADDTDQSGGPVTDSTEVAEVASVRGDNLVVLPQRGADPALGRAVPSVEGVGFDGQAVTVPQQGPGVIAVLAHWCPNCQAEVPVIMDLRSSGRWPANVALSAVSTEVDPERGNFPAAAWLERENWDAPVLVDTRESTAARAYGVNGFPFMVWYDADGKVVLRTSGQIPEGELARMLDQLSRGETPKATRA